MVGQTNAPRERRERHDGWTKVRQEKFLANLAETACVQRACEAAGKTDTTGLYRLRGRDAAFDAQWEEAMDRAMDALFACAYARTSKGVERKLFHAGKHYATVVDYSERMTMFLLNKYKPVLHKRLVEAHVADVIAPVRPAAAMAYTALDRVIAAAARLPDG